MMERFAETIREVAIVGFERVGKRVSPGFKHQAYTLIVVQNMIKRCGTAVLF